MKTTDSKERAIRRGQGRRAALPAIRFAKLLPLLPWLAGPVLSALLAGQGAAAVLPTNVTLYAATFGGGTFVSVGASGAIYSSTNGGPWDPRVSGTTNRLEAVVFGAGIFVAAGENGTLLSSPDGVTWTSRSITATQSMPQAAYGNGRFVIAGKGGIGQWTMLVSSNAIDWSTVNVEAPGPASAPAGMPFGALAFGAGRFIAAGGTTGGAKQFLTSTNGISWKEQGAEGTSTASARYGPMIHGNGLFAVIENYYDTDDDDSGFYDRLLISEDGNFWSWGSFFGSVDWKAVAAGDCTWVLARDNPFGGGIYSASRMDPYNMQVANAPTIDVVNALAFGNGKFFAFGSDIVEVPVPPVPPVIPITPTNYVVYPTSGYLYFTAGGSCLSPPVFYQWRHNGVPLPDETNTYLQIYPISAADAGQYTVIATNLLGQMEMSVVAEVMVTNPPASAPFIGYPTTRITNSVPRGNDISPGVSVSGIPTPSFQWRFNGVDVPGATNSYLQLFNVQTAAEGAYTLFASNASGTALSPEIVLDVFDNPSMFSSFTNNYIAREESRFEFISPYGYWFYPYWLGGTELHVFKNDVPYRLPITTGYSVVLNRTALSDAGEYRFVISNAFGASTVLVANVTVVPTVPLDRWTQRNPLPQHEELFDAAYGNGTFVAVGNRGSVTHSPDGVEWTATRTTGEASLSGVTFGNGVFVAVAGANIFTSSNGATWTLRLARFDLMLTSVILGNGRFVAVGSDAIVTSTDGITWSDATLSFTIPRQWREVAFGNGTFVAVGDGRLVPGIWVSSDGMNWSPAGGAPVDELESVAFGNGLFVAVGDDGAIYTSPNGTSWTARNSTVGTRLLGVSYGAGRFVVVGSRGRVLTSANGTSWNRENSGTPDRLNGVRFGNNLFVAVGENGTILMSPNGSFWVQRSQGSTRDLDGMAQGNGLIAIVGKGGTIMTSSDGAQFTLQNSGVTNDLHGVGFANGLFVAVGEPEIILTSSNGVQWQTRHSGGISSLKNVRRGNNGWVAVGTEGTILTSVDGMAWTARTSTTCNDLNDVTYAQGLYVVVGDNLPPNGTLLTSPDGITWTRRPQFIGKNLRSVNYLNDTFIATANDENFIVSSNASQWQLRTTGLYPGFGQNLRAATYAAGQWVLVGNTGTVLSSSNALDWTRHSTPVLENFHGITFLNNRFVVMGNRGTILQSHLAAPAPVLFGRLGVNGFDIGFHTATGVSYELQAADALGQSWTTIRTFTSFSGGTAVLTDSASRTQRFYRVVAP